MANAKRFLELDALRGIAALGVLACHYTSQCHGYGLLSIEFRWGAYGPHLFFIISGFVILMTLERCKRPRDFIYSRCKRLYPQYWISVLLSASLLVVFQPNDLSIPSVTQILVNLTMLQTWLRIPDIEVSYWTLGVELKFYLLLFSVYLARQLQRIEIVSCVWLSSVLVFRVIELVIAPLPHALATPIILDYAHLFVAGLMSYRMHAKGFTWLRATLFGLSIPFQYLAEGIESAVMVAFFCLVFAVFISGRLKWINVRPLIFLGKISYPLYLVHGTIGHLAIKQLYTSGSSTLLLLLVSTTLSIALAIFLQFGAWHLLCVLWGCVKLVCKGDCHGETKASRAV